jgi:hypothetical protein
LLICASTVDDAKPKFIWVKISKNEETGEEVIIDVQRSLTMTPRKTSALKVLGSRTAVIIYAPNAPNAMKAPTFIEISPHRTFAISLTTSPSTETAADWASRQVSPQAFGRCGHGSSRA